MLCARTAAECACLTWSRTQEEVAQEQEEDNQSERKSPIYVSVDYIRVSIFRCPFLVQLLVLESSAIGPQKRHKNREGGQKKTGRRGGAAAAIMPLPGFILVSLIL